MPTKVSNKHQTLVKANALNFPDEAIIKWSEWLNTLTDGARISDKWYIEVVVTKEWVGHFVDLKNLHLRSNVDVIIQEEGRKQFLVYLLESFFTFHHYRPFYQLSSNHITIDILTFPFGIWDSQLGFGLLQFNRFATIFIWICLHVWYVRS